VLIALHSSKARSVEGCQYLCTCVACLLTCLLSPWSRVLLEKLTGSQSRNSPHFMETEGSLPHSQVPATCPYPEPDQSRPFPHISLPEDPSYTSVTSPKLLHLLGLYFIVAQDMPALSHRTRISVGTSRDRFGAQDSST
jgi:hypothetical protein